VLINFVLFLRSKENDETEEESSNITDSSASEDEDESICSIVMSSSENGNSLDTSDLIKNYAIMLEVPTALTTSSAPV
jgi:hypothetical protein